MTKSLGIFFVDVVLIFVGVFLMITAYSRKTVLLKIATLGTLKIDPDNPGTTARAVVFTIGVMLVIFGLLFIILERLKELGMVG